MAGMPYIEFESSMAAAIGTAVESYVAAYVSKTRGDNPHIKLQTLLDKIKMLDQDKLKEALDTSKIIANKLLEMNALLPLLEAGEVLIGREIYRHSPGPAILGIIDFLVDGIPLDFKCRGWNKIQKVSPYRGYGIIYKSTGGINNKPSTSIEETNPEWAAQLVFYNWLTERDDNQYKIWEICRFSSPDSAGTPAEYDFRLAIHDNRVSKAFSEELTKDCESMWESVTGLDIDVLPPEYSQWKCIPFHSPCIVADRCSAYRDHLDEEME